MIRFRQIKGILLAFMFAGIPVARATTIEIGLSAEVSYIDDGGLLEGLLNIGDVVTGRYSYDSETPDTNPSNTAGIYWHYEFPCGIVLSAGEYTFETDPGNIIFRIGIGDGDDGHDTYSLISYSNLPLSNDVEVFSIWWQLNDYSQMALSSDALPLGPPILEDWEYDWGLRIELGPKGDTMVTADVTSVWLIPEPATVLLLGLGALALLRMRRRG